LTNQQTNNTNEEEKEGINKKLKAAKKKLKQIEELEQKTFE